jgi:hypothetical protein
LYRALYRKPEPETSSCSRTPIHTLVLSRSAPPVASEPYRNHMAFVPKHAIARVPTASAPRADRACAPVRGAALRSSENPSPTSFHRRPTGPLSRRTRPDGCCSTGFSRRMVYRSSPRTSARCGPRLAGETLAQPLQSPEGWLTLRICRKANGQPWKTLRRDGTACCVYTGNKAIARGT